MTAGDSMQTLNQSKVARDSSNLTRALIPLHSLRWHMTAVLVMIFLPKGSAASSRAG
jgi:hypothetical protein